MTMISLKKELILYLLDDFSGSYFCYDTPGSLQNQIKDDMKVDTAQFASLYALYSWPNVVLSFVGGFLIDRYKLHDFLSI